MGFGRLPDPAIGKAGQYIKLFCRSKSIFFNFSASHLESLSFQPELPYGMVDLIYDTNSFYITGY